MGGVRAPRGLWARLEWHRPAAQLSRLFLAPVSCSASFRDKTGIIDIIKHTCGPGGRRGGLGLLFPLPDNQLLLWAVCACAAATGPLLGGMQARSRPQDPGKGTPAWTLGVCL